MSRPDGRVPPLEDVVDEGSNVLLLAPSMAAGDDEGCSRLLGFDGGDDVDALSVTLTGSPDDRIAAWGCSGDDTPAKMGFVSVGGVTRSAASSSGTLQSPTEGISIDTVSSPADLTGLGIKISGFLSDWVGDGNRIVVCVHSLTTLLQYVELQELFRFLHVITGRFSAANAIAHYHMDPSAHSEQEINTLKALFDAVVQLDDDGEWTILTR